MQRCGNGVGGHPIVAETLPELGPYLGRLAEPEHRRLSDAWSLDELRLSVVSALFERATTARGFLESGNLVAARSTLGAEAWLEVWNHAVQSATVLTLSELRRRLVRAGAESGMPHRLVGHELPSPEDERILAAKLSSAGIPLEDFLAEPDADRSWPDALRLSANALETSWLGLESIVRHELARYVPTIERLRAWKRPTALLWVITLLMAASAIYLGLVLGGYLPTPGILAGFKAWWWTLPWP